MSNELKNEVELKILQYLNGQTPEKNKFEIKRSWYDLLWKHPSAGDKASINRQYFEFLKDCASIINSYGRDEGFIVIGIDQDTKECFDTNISQSNLDDSSKIKNVILKNLDQAFLIDIDYLTVGGKQLSIIHIPPSATKPHLIRDYWSANGNHSENVIFLRNGSGAQVATKGDLDRMYWERSNIVLDRKVELSLNPKNLNFYNSLGEGTNAFVAKISLENLGTRGLLVDRIAIHGTYKAFSVDLLSTSFRTGEDSKSTQRLKTNSPVNVTLKGRLMAVNHSDYSQRISIKELAANTAELKFESALVILTNHDEILSIPRVST